MAVTSRSYLERHGSKWRVVVKVPAAARPVLGKAHLKQGLNTDSLAEANRQKMAYVAEFHSQINVALGLSVQRPADANEEASALRAGRRVQQPRYETIWNDEEGRELVIEVDDIANHIDDRADEIEQEQGVDAAKRFADAAFGRSVPLDDYLQDFIDDPDTPYVPKSVLDLRRAVERLKAFLRQTSRPDALQAFDRSAAQDFLRSLRVRIAHKTIAKYRGFLTSYWDWMEERGHVPDGRGLWEVKTSRRGRKLATHSPSRERHVEDDEGKRPFSGAELQVLLNGTPSRPYMADLIRIAALSGMRIEEIYRLRVQDCEDGAFNIRSGKTTNAKRMVPIHSALMPIVDRLLQGQAGSAFLIDPLAAVIDTTGLRSGAATKAFTRYRRGCGVDERPNDKSKSNVDFHSLRRWFVTEAEAALGRGASGYTVMTIADVVGHDTAGMAKALPMTLGVYRGKAGEDARRACIEAVSLPGVVLP